jgi:tetratricopeptide (TPR) repeat protein
MLGTIGQTYAFMSKLNPEYSEKAEFYFLKSFKFFIEDSIHQQMSINFLTILAWYCNNLEQAKKYFGMRKNISEGKSLTTWVKAIVVRSENNIGKTFDISILLRLLAIEQIGTKKIIELTEEYIYSMDKIKEHPFELIYKWLGVNYLLQDNYRQSIIYFDKAFDITENGFFTLQTIGISILGLKAIALFKDNKKENAEEVILQLQDITDILMQQSPSFADYIKSIGGTKQMCDDINHYKIIDTAKWLPFAYA